MNKSLSKEAACAGRPTAMFFEDSWHKRKLPHSTGLMLAREVCDTCPVRGACLAMEMELEQGAAIDHRAGIFAGTTPQQRYSLERREVDWNGSDPTLLRDGILGNGSTMLPIPDRGDAWTPRHTVMAQDVIAWLVENVQVDGEVPTSGRLARQLGIRVNDLRRVYEALEADQILERIGKDTIVRRAQYTSAKGWVPPHLRIDA